MSVSLDEFLTKQAADVPRPRYTIEAADKPGRVVVTPWQKDRGCLCRAALELDRAVIASVKPTGDVHDCCGKRLQVVEAEFATGSGDLLHDVFGQMLARNDGECEQCNLDAQDCLANAGSPGEKMACTRAWRRCRKENHCPDH